jgi:hypothetical protein
MRIHDLDTTAYIFQLWLEVRGDVIEQSGNGRGITIS